MEQYISKSAVENILRNLWQTDNVQNSEHRICYNKALQEVQCELDTLEVKEVDLEKEKEVKVKGFVAVDNGGDKMTWNPTGRRVAFFPKKPVRDLLTDSHYWAAHISPYDVIHLGYDAFPELKWEDEPIEVEITINKN